MATVRPTKQRKKLFQSPNHLRRKLLSSPLSDDLFQKHGIRRLPLRVGDSVRIERGDFAGLEGKIERIDYGNRRIYVEGMTREKSAGVASKLTVHPSKVLVTNLNLSDKWRTGLLAEKGKAT